MAIGTVRVEMDNGIVYEGEVKLLNYAPLVSHTLERTYSLDLVLSHCDIIRPGKPQTQIEKIVIELVDAIKAEIDDV